MSRYIDADELVRYMEERQERLKDDESLWELSVVETFLGRASSADVVEVVRCKDCKWWDSEEHNCVIRDSYGWDYKPTDYCSYGENAEAQEESEIINARRGEE